MDCVFDSAVGAGADAEGAGASYDWVAGWR